MVYHHEFRNFSSISKLIQFSGLLDIPEFEAMGVDRNDFSPLDEKVSHDSCTGFGFKILSFEGSLSLILSEVRGA